MQQGVGSAVQQAHAQADGVRLRIAGGDGVGGAHEALVSLEQHIETKMAPPPGLRGLLKRLVAKQCRDMVEDLRAELERRKVGQGRGSHKAPAAAGGDKKAPAGVGKKKAAAAAACVCSGVPALRPALPLASCTAAPLGGCGGAGGEGAALLLPAAAAWQSLWESREPLINITVQL